MSLANVVNTSEEKKEETFSFKPLAKSNEGDGMKLMLYGEPETGKTYFALSCPPPVYIISTEYGVKKVSHHFKDKDFQIVECYEPYGDKLKDKDGKEDIVPLRRDPIGPLRKIEKAADDLGYAILSGKIKPGGTVVIDSVSDVWNWLSILLDYRGEKQISKKTGEEYLKGNEWQKVNDSYRTLVNKFNALPMHLVLTARVKEERDKEKNIIGLSAKAAKDANHFVDYVIRLEKKLDINAAKQGQTVLERIATIEKSRVQAVNNLKIKDLTFDKLKAHYEKLGLGSLFDIKV